MLFFIKVVFIKRLLLIIMLCGFSATLSAIQQSDLKEMGLKGQVKKWATKSYRVKDEKKENEWDRIIYFNQSGFITKRESYINFRLLSTYFYEYSPEGKLIKTYTLDNEPRALPYLEVFYTYTQNADGTETQKGEIIYSETGMKGSHSENTFNSKGLLIFNRNMLSLTGYSYHYDEQGMITEVVNHDSDEPYEEFINTYTNGKLIKRVKKLRGNIENIAYFDQSGHRVKEEEFSESGELLFTTNYTNQTDKAGNLIKIMKSSDFSEIVTENYYEYY
ncbi:MAG TPA: hypothetical protein DD638_12175 [Pasteurellaceae bacterium]|nr:hypothetical protein [Pasteurellaceae bacterium]